MITFTYHEDIQAAERFYGDTLELEQVMDRGWVKIFKLGKDSHIGLVDAEHGHLKPSKDKPVMLTIVVEDADSWYSALQEKGVKANGPPAQSGELDMKGFLIWDPSGYVIEVLEFVTKPYGE